MAIKLPVILLIDEDERYILRLKDHLIEKLEIKPRIYTFNSGEQCLANLSLRPDIVILNYYFSPKTTDNQNIKPINGIELIRQLKAQNPEIHLILLSNETDVEIANLAISEGAYDYISNYEYAPIQLQYLINNIILKKNYTRKINYWKWGAIAIGLLFLLVLIYLVSGINH